ncbi:hypothetical protein R0135_11805 [Congregibacter variabilis]|uniref:Uncharacterized protein n=1 Tax=Congregibacter variabilis TaxID=3081200 RepID=A0ABZ0I0B1_9GAMM|nr:hypothetical protein R0135_11805 [Congregibacter sp. IMCC43200]
MKSNAILGATVFMTAAVLSASSGVIAESTSSMDNVEYRWEVDMRGKPPYKRERVPVNTIDVAAMEIIDVNVATEVVWQTDFTGRPPFSRKQVELPVVDAAAMELIEDEPKTTTFRGRPPFNRHR